MAGHAVASKPNGRGAAPTPQKKPKQPMRRGGADRDRNLAEVGAEELLGQQQPGDALTTDAPTSDDRVPEVGQEELTGQQYPGDAVQADT
jgi:arginine decarboxylase